jgi:hypothetical protein
MAQASLERATERLAEIRAEIQTLGPAMRGSVTIMGTRHKQPYFSASIKGRTRLIYLGEQRAETARRYVASYRRLAELIDEQTLLNMRLLRGSTTRQSKRPATQPTSAPGR